MQIFSVYKSRKDQSPDYMRQYFKPLERVHSYNTRSREKGSFQPPPAKGFGSKTFSYVGSNLWNSLPTDIRNLSSLAQFKKATKDQYFNL